MVDRWTITLDPDDWDQILVVTAFNAIALYNFVELNAMIFTTFKRRSGLYFWSFLVSSNGVAPYAIGFLLKDLHLSPSPYIDITLIIIGWVTLVTGQAFVLYSRLHLVMRDKTKLRLVLVMIIVNAIICHVPTTIFVYGANSANPTRWIKPYQIYEKIEVTLFFVVESILSGIYIWKTLSFFRFEATLHARPLSQLMMHLIWINVVIILLDATILALEYAGFYNLQTAYKGMVYSIKLKLEFKVLNGLIELTKYKTPRGSWTNQLAAQTPCAQHLRSGSTSSGRGGGNSSNRGGIYDGTDPGTGTVNFETFNDTLSRIHDTHKTDRPDSAYEVRIFAGEGGSRDSDSANADGITVRTTMEVTTTKAEPWEAMSCRGIESLHGSGEARPDTAYSQADSYRLSDLELAQKV
ncbi:hypothetical protein JX265_009325 [Neoarthrinium moseri]|uniref:DUF7703 domain-containing protein n=1 Tax=Neoarthrinium moseri TaxID=1658444 RepID=A0A9P9WGE1_9PEZI|nr:uncharacterized protein JN550_012463 [Neoarthrinium moseri]KAI1841660.1 hypothetical protein JX266_012125 [Neoarthrinium moseri]KAI1858809.1 hypothetical protein JN550_012463 [Neoarthrinium moseri]KAI1861822.1 hypothetical protein JX265_009325 [Neoarthrinium moseri]